MQISLTYQVVKQGKRHQHQRLTNTFSFYAIMFYIALHLHAVHRCRLLLQMSRIAWSLTLCVRHKGEYAEMAEVIKMPLGTDSCGPSKCIRRVSRLDESIRCHKGWQNNDAEFCLITLDARCLAGVLNQITSVHVSQVHQESLWELHEQSIHIFASRRHWKGSCKKINRWNITDN